MKILITLILTSLFLLSSASAEDIKLNSIKEICLKYELLIQWHSNNLDKANNIKPSQNHSPENQKTIENSEKAIEKHAKLYHYLDCADFRD